MSSRLALLPDDIIGQIMALALEPLEKAARLIQRMLRGTHARYKLFDNYRDITPPFFFHIKGSNNTLPFLLDRLKGRYLSLGGWPTQADGMERYQRDARFITKFADTKRHRHYPPKVRAKIFYADL